MAAKPVRRADFREIVYSDARWALLREHREKAKHIMKALESSCLRTLVHGSLARGDVTKNSDVDIHLTRTGIIVPRRNSAGKSPNYC